ncbi:energy transducer TonB [Hymenobacter amundsenii]|nr:energy transducer TonB [Hymenobacter amundsenii]
MRKLYTVLLLLATLSATAQRNRKNTASPTQPVYEKGALTSGQPTGIWEYYDRQGELTLRMNYDSSRIAYSRPDTARYLLNIDNKWQEVHPSRAPQYMGSRDKRLVDLASKTRYPVSALQNQVQGVVVLSYVVTEQGQSVDYKIESTPSKDCAEAVWAAVIVLPDRWIPAVYQGKPVAARFFLRVGFTMVGQNELRAHQAALAAAAKSPKVPYVDQMEVTALGIERSVRSVTVPRPGVNNQTGQMRP